jgi:hypothetical protein
LSGRPTSRIVATWSQPRSHVEGFVIQLPRDLFYNSHGSLADTTLRGSVA